MLKSEARPANEAGSARVGSRASLHAIHRPQRRRVFPCVPVRAAHAGTPVQEHGSADESGLLVGIRKCRSPPAEFVVKNRLAQQVVTSEGAVSHRTHQAGNFLGDVATVSMQANHIGYGRAASTQVSHHPGVDCRATQRRGWRHHHRIRIDAGVVTVRPDPFDDAGSVLRHPYQLGCRTAPESRDIRLIPDFVILDVANTAVHAVLGQGCYPIFPVLVRSTAIQVQIPRPIALARAAAIGRSFKSATRCLVAR